MVIPLGSHLIYTWGGTRKFCKLFFILKLDHGKRPSSMVLLPGPLCKPAHSITTIISMIYLHPNCTLPKWWSWSRDWWGDIVCPSCCIYVSSKWALYVLIPGWLAFPSPRPSTWTCQSFTYLSPYRLIILITIFVVQSIRCTALPCPACGRTDLSFPTLLRLHPKSRKHKRPPFLVESR